MIETAEQYQKAQEELRHLEGWLQRLQKDHPVPAKGLTKACCPLSALIPVSSASFDGICIFRNLSRDCSKLGGSFGDRANA